MAIEVRMSAESRNLRTIRTLVLPYLRTHVVDLETINELLIAIDEACTRLQQWARPGAEMRCGIEPAENGLRIYVAVQPLLALPPPTDDPGWRALTALTDSVELCQMKSPWLPHEEVTAIRFTRYSPMGEVEAPRSAAGESP